MRSTEHGIYFKSVFLRAVSNGKGKALDKIITAIVTILGLFTAAVRGGAITLSWSSSWSTVKWQPTVYGLGYFVVPLVIYHYLRAQWEIHKETTDLLLASQNESKELKEFIKDFQTTDVTIQHFAQVAGKIWNLKNYARDIRRKWPNTDFNKRPLYSQSWIPSPDSDQECPWLRPATKWKDDVSGLPYVKTIPEEHLNMMDFEEVMEMLDDAERFSRGQQPFRTLFYSGSPDVHIVGLAFRDSPGYVNSDLDFVLRNHGGSASHIMVSPPVTIGTYNVASVIRTQPLLTSHGDAHLRSLISKAVDSRITLYPDGLLKEFSQLPVNDNGVRLSPVLRIIYQDTRGDRYVSKHEINLDSSGSVVVTYRYRELLPMPLWKTHDGLSN